MNESMKETLRKEKTETVRNAILDAADSIIKSEGIEKVSIRKVASMIGYSPGNIYQYFSDKDELINHTVMRGYQRLMQSVKDIEGDPDDIVTLIESRFTAYAIAVLDNPIFYKAVMFSDKSAILEHTRILDENAILERPPFKKLIDEIEKGILLKQIRPEDPVILAQSIWCAVFGILSRGVLESEDKSSIAELVKRTIKRMI